jgi:hypothetical protein
VDHTGCMITVLSQDQMMVVVRSVRIPADNEP